MDRVVVEAGQVQNSPLASINKFQSRHGLSDRIRRGVFGANFLEFSFFQCYKNTIILFKMSVKLTCSFESQSTSAKNGTLPKTALATLFRRTEEELSR